jgi:hypothetical protein
MFGRRRATSGEGTDLSARGANVFGTGGNGPRSI